MEGPSALGSVFERVHPPTTFEQTVERLGTAIRLGLLTPGSRLPPERELATQLGIARSTLRQALTLLVQSGHLIALRGRTGGTFVAAAPPLSDGNDELGDNWREVCDARVAIECGAALLAAERGDGSAFDRMAESIERMDTPADFDDYRRCDVRFHLCIAEAAGTPRIVARMTEVQGELTDLLALARHPDPILAKRNAEHREVLSALRDGDGIEAVRRLRAHLAATEDLLAQLAT
jgi:GntR family transcriptional regulator, transcriptional repressor for pyruvate dehydrogenase complex